MFNSNRQRKNAPDAQPDEVGRVLRALPGAAGGYLIRVTEEGFEGRYEARVEKASDCAEDDGAFAARVSDALTVCVGVAPARVTALPEGALGGEGQLIDERTLSYEI
jgi:hypothetical protein